MSQSEYFINKFSKSDQKLLYENPKDFLASHKQQLTQIVRDDMHKLAAIATPVHTTKDGCTPYDSWTDHLYWYYVAGNNKETVSKMFDVYYSLNKLDKPNVWDLNGDTTIFEIMSREYVCQDSMFHCLRYVYFYDNYNNKDKWNMSWIPYRNRIYAAEGRIDTNDFIDFDYKTKACKQRHSKQVLADRIDSHCYDITRHATNVINRDVWAQKRQTDTARKEIEQAYAVLRKYGLLSEKSEQNQRS